MVSAISLCLLAVGFTAVSSQLLSAEEESPDAPISDRRTFKHGKPVKFLPLVKKHKKFGGFVPHVFGKTQYADVPIIHEAPKPLFKVHRYQGIELRPLPEVSISTPEPFIETHSIEPPLEFGSVFSSDHPFPAPFPPSNFLLYPVNDKPIVSSSTFSAPTPGPILASLPPPPPPKPVFSFPPPSHPVIPSLPITAAPSFISIARPASAPILSQVPVIPPPFFAPVPASVPIRSPQPVFSSSPIKIQPPLLPPLPSPTSAPVFSSVSVKVPAPSLPSIPVTPAPPVFSTVSIAPPPPAHAFPSIPPPSIPPVPAPLPISVSSLPILPSPAPALSSISVSALPEPDFPYPPSGVPIPSFVKDISLGDIEIKDSPLPTNETPKYQEVTTATIDHGLQNLNHASVIKAEDGLLQRLKGWKADKASAALSHLSHFKQKPFAQFLSPISQTTDKIPLEIPAPPTPVYPTLQFPSPAHPLPLAQAPLFFPPSPQFFSPAKYESYPPNNIEPPPVLNSYGVPIPHDSYSARVSQDRLSSAASEEKASVVPAPKKDQISAPKLELQQRPSAQLLQEFQTPNFQNQFPALSPPHGHPVYVPDESKSANEEDKTTEDTQSEANDYPSTPQHQNSESAVSDAQNYRNHKE